MVGQPFAAAAPEAEAGLGEAGCWGREEGHTRHDRFGKMISILAGYSPISNPLLTSLLVSPLLSRLVSS